MDKFVFKKAKPVWAKGRQNEMNVRMGFSAQLKRCDAHIYIACSSGYQLFVNGKFVCAGPARTAHGFFRVDDISLKEHLDEDENFVSLIVWGYNVNSYSVLDQPSFSAAEITCDDIVIAATGDSGFAAYELYDHIQKVQRYTYQRAFVESYVIKKDTYEWMIDNIDTNTVVVPVKAGTFIQRRVPYPDYERYYPNDKVIKGTFKIEKPEKYRTPWYLDIDEPDYKRFLTEELAEDTCKMLQDVSYDTANIEYPDVKKGISLVQNEYAIYEFERETTGMISFRVKCEKPCEFMMVYDEKLSSGITDPIRIRGLWVNKYVLEPGEYTSVFFEPVSMKFLNTVMLSGTAHITDLHMIEYKYPEISKTLDTDNIDLLNIFNAAVETFRQNTLDIYMDCPSRERAGWLCDSFFTSRVEYFLTGKSVVEKAFLENYLLPDKFSHLPDGMLPMCYPADHTNGRFIPNWAMWLVLELYEYKQRSDDVEMIDAFKSRVYALCEYFEPFLNKDGLLQDLESWVFVEWSQANNFVQNVNFPTNMLYAKMLDTVSVLYDDNDKKRQADDIRGKICELSFDNEFFCDRMVVKDDKLVTADDKTEVCQYYAFFTDTATIETHPELWDRLVKYFGPDRHIKGDYPDIHGANAFVGTYLRLELLSRVGLHKQILDESYGFFKYMADATGTLWENKTDNASLNHGFASHAAIWIDNAVKAEKKAN